MSRKALIFGISGQDGAYLASLLLEKGYAVYGTSRDREITRFENLRRLGVFDRVTLQSVSLADFRSVASVMKATDADELYNLAGQSSVGLSFDQPVETIDSSVNGTINILEAMRFLGSKARLYNASSSECFGNTTDGPANEMAPFRPCSPYGIGKAGAQWLVSNYREAYGLFACSGILFNHESPLRPARFVTQKIIQGALDIAEGRADTLTLGNLEIGRDWGWAPEYVEAMWQMLQLDSAQDFVVATGHLHKLQDFVELAFSTVGLNWQQHVIADPSLHRPLDILTSVGDAAKARQLLGWEAKTGFSELIKKLMSSEMERRGKHETQLERRK